MSRKGGRGSASTSPRRTRRASADHRHRRRPRRTDIRHKTPFYSGATSASCQPIAAGSRAVESLLLNAVPCWPVLGASLLVGMSVAFMAVGLVERLSHALIPDPFGTRSVVAAMFFASAIGVRAPHRLTYRYGVAAWQRLAKPSAPADLSPFLERSRVDHPLCWTVLAVVALLSGVAAALTPLVILFLTFIHDSLLAHFVWSSLPLAALQILLAFVACLIPFAGIGLSVASLSALWPRRNRWGFRTLANVLPGAGAGCLLLAVLGIDPMRADTILLAGSLPLLIVAMIACASASSKKVVEPIEKESQLASPPTSIDGRPTLLRASIVAVGGGGACAITVWMQELVVAGAERLIGLGVFLALLALGIWIRHARRRDTAPTVGSFGGACAIAGLGIAAGAMALLLNPPLPTSLVMIQAALGLAAIGYCLSYGCEVLLARVAHRPAVNSLTLARLLICAGVTVWLTAPLAVWFFGRSGALVLLAISLMALGGVLIFHEPRLETAPRRFRLGAVFALIALLMLIARPAGKVHELGGAGHQTCSKTR